MDNPVKLLGIRIITVSGRIGSGSTTLAKSLSKILGWKHVEGGEVFWEEVRKRLGLEEKDTNLRPDKDDEDFDASLRKLLKKDKDIILETKLAGFNAKNISEVFKILVICENDKAIDQSEIRIDRIINREKISVEKAKAEVLQREENDIEKWRRLYSNGDQNWVYWDKKYYDLVINTYSHNQEESLKFALEKIGYKD